MAAVEICLDQLSDELENEVDRKVHRYLKCHCSGFSQPPEQIYAILNSSSKIAWVYQRHHDLDLQNNWRQSQCYLRQQNSAIFRDNGGSNIINVSDKPYLRTLHFSKTMC